VLEVLDKMDRNAGVLDLGCGPGNLRAALRSRGWNGHYVGVDVSEEVIEVAKKLEDNNAEWHVSTIEDFPITSHVVSTICLCETIYYVNPESVSRVLAQCRQSLVSGGRIVIRIWDTEQHRDYVALIESLGAQSNPPIYILTKE
jgi:SAM-dependent methyltransferase